MHTPLTTSDYDRGYSTSRTSTWTAYPETKTALAITPLRSHSPAPAPTPSIPHSSSKSNTGFFDSFDPTTYCAHLRNLDDATLRQKERSKLSSQCATAAGLGASTFAAFLSGGITAPFVAITARKLYLVEMKLPLVQEEVTRRGLRLQKIRNRDLFKAMGKAVFKGGFDAMND